MELKELNEKIIKPNLPQTRKEWIWFILIILVVITLGLVSVNAYLEIQYKATLILSPCNLCDTFQRNIYVNGNHLDLRNISFVNLTKT